VQRTEEDGQKKPRIVNQKRREIQDNGGRDGEARTLSSLIFYDGGGDDNESEDLFY
jgi:hypothetical protein